ncbi:cupin 2 conserved barrel domain protein [Exidia glandulosa HHB12029]|uniref:Cupin 2 conserved barrel domain protein n=1 Tax=Exidia glandulosa HHB12029 TaxID=1314781 RepID=A0A165PPP3_EXIGL|nr:cupin 2 conserved barrel domain protein [Exidia glandulosa HHB12029]
MSSLRPAISVPAVLDATAQMWSPKLIASINGEYEMKVAKMQGSFVMHAHHTTDELFYVIFGTLRIELEGVEQKEVVLKPGDVFVVPRGVRHKPIVDEGLVEVMLLEKTGVINTGDAQGADAESLTNAVEDVRR